jgi:non-ribosomal peptide synthetase component F
MSLEAVSRQRIQTGGGGRGIGRADRGRPLPLSVGQQQMWLLHQFDPTSPAYLMTWTVRLSGPLDTEGLRWAWERVVDRHEVLRTRYVAQGDEPVQVVDPPGRFDLRVIDLTGEPEDRREERAGQVAAWERGRPVDLHTRGPLQVSLITLGEQSHLMVVTIHHIACDDVSFRRIATEVSACYARHGGGSAPPLSDVDLQYRDYAAWEHACRADGRLRPHLDHWRRALDGVTELPLPLDRPRPAQSDWRGGVVDIAITAETAERVRAVAAAHRASPYMVLLAAYHATLAHLSGSDDVTVGLPVSARTRPELDDLVGYLVNTVVVRSRQASTGTFADLLGDVREGVLDAMDHRAAPFKWVVDAVHPARTSAANPLFQVAFDMEGVEESPFRFPGVRVEQLALAEATAAKFDLTLHVEEQADGGFGARLEFATAVLDEDTVRTWADHWGAVLAAAAGAPDVPLHRLHERAGAPRPARATVPAPATPADAADDGLVERIRLVWCEVLGSDDIAVWDNFFDVGGDSLRAVALAGRLKADGLDVSATDIFAHQTIEELAQACAGHRADPAERPAAAPFSLLTPADRALLPPGLADAYPLTAMQLGMLIELRARPDLNTYQDTTSYLIRDTAAFDPAALQAAVQLVVDRHEVLRTGFDMNRYSEPVQLVHEHAEITVGVANHGLLGPDGWLPRLRDYAARERRSPMDLAHPPLIRVFAHTADGTREWWITITECHPILEGWSFHSMLMEILTGYRAIRAGHTPVEQAPVAVRYADYVAAEAAARASDEDRAFWRAAVTGRADAVPPEAWREDPRTPRERYQHLVNFRDIEDDLRRLAAETRTSMKAVLLAAHMKVMSMVTAREDFFTGLVCDARPEVAGAERVLGMYLNTVPFAMPTGARTWGELVRAVYDALTGLWPHRVFPLQAIQQEFAHRGRLLEVFFNYLDFHQVDEDLVDGDQTLNDNDNEFALHVFTMTGVLKFNTTNHCLSRAAADRLAALYRTVLAEMSLGPDGDATGPCLPRAERAVVTGAPATGERATVLAAFLATAAARPGAPAIRKHGREISYGQLHLRALAAADRLRHRGTGHGDVVVLAERLDLDAVADLLGAWLVGAAVSSEKTEAPGLPGTAWTSPSGPALSHDALAHALAPGLGGPDSAWSCTAPWPTARAVTDLLAALYSGGVAVLGDDVPGSRGQAAVEVPGLPGWVAFDGFPVPGLDVRVVDTAGRQVPSGVVGELCVAGGQRTGLLARFTATGALEPMGPVEHTFRGEQPVDLYRTRELLDAQPSIVDSVVVLRDRLIGYVRTETGVPFSVDDVRRALAARRLPRPLIPDVLVPVENWPLAEAGTLDLDALPAPPDTEAAPDVRPWDQTFDDLLRTTFAAASATLTPDTPLADAGLDSFGTVGLLVAIEQAYDITIPDDFQILDMFRTASTLWDTVSALRDAR